MDLKEFRQNNPDYNDMSDKELADALHAKFYSDVPKDDFYKSIGMGKRSVGDKISDDISAVHRFVTGADKPGDTTYADKAMQGMTFNFGDNLRAGVRTGAGLFGDYDKELADIRTKEKEFDKKHPVGSVVSELAGGLAIAPTLAGASGATGLTKLGARYLPGAVRAGISGAAAGGAYAAGASEGDMLPDAAKGAAVGGLLGPVAYGAGRGAAALGRGARMLVRGVDGKGGALNALASDLAEDQITPARLQSRLKFLGPQATITDAARSPNVISSARAVSSTQAGRTKAGVLMRRASGESGRAVEKIRQTIAPSDYFAAEDAFVGKLRGNADALYKKAYETRPIQSHKLNEMLSRKPIRQAIAKAKEIAEIEGAKINIPDKLGNGIPVEAVDDIKKGIDALLDSPKALNKFGRLNKYGMALSNLKKQILEEVDNLVPAYKTARLQYSGDAEVLSALQDGKDFMKLAPEQITRKLNGLRSEAAKKAYRSGMARSLVDKVQGTRDTSNASQRIFGDKLTRDKIRAGMDRESFRDLERTLRSEMQFNQVKNTVLGGSQTQPRLAGEKDLISKLGTAAAVASSNLPVGHSLVVAGGARRTMQNWANKLFDAKSAKLAEMLLTRDPVKNAKLIDDLVRLYGASGKTSSPAFSRALARMAAQQGVDLIDTAKDALQ